MRILHSIIGVLYHIAVEERVEREKIKRQEQEKEAESNRAESGKSIEDVRSYFKEYLEKKEVERKEIPNERPAKSGNVTIEDFQEDEQEQAEEEPDGDAEEEVKGKKADSISTQITRRQREFARQILEKARHFVGYSIKELKMLILGILVTFNPFYLVFFFFF